MCARCSRLGAICDYPPPPDRKALATFRATPRKRKLNESNIETPVHDEYEGSSPSASPQLYRATTIEHNNEVLDHFGVQLSDAAHKLLQETYFTCMFNATLVFHRPSFSKAFQDGELAHDILLAVYATATM